MSAEEAHFERELRTLRERAAAELGRLEDERRRLRGLIAFIDDYGRPGNTRRSKRTRPHRPQTRHQAEPLLEIIRQRPGVRASMLAMVTGREVDDVNAELAAYKQAGKVHRQGLGWRIASD